MGAGKSKTVAENMNFDLSVLDSLAGDAKKVIENHFESQEATINELKESYERFKVEAEKKQFELENQLIASNQKGERESRTASVLRQQLADLEARYAEASQLREEAQKQARELETKRADEERVKNQLIAEKEDLSQILDRRDQENKRLTEEWKSMSEKVAAASKARIDAISRLDEIQSQDVNTQHRTSRLQQEVESLRQQVQWLETEVNEKAELVLETRKEKTSATLELQSQVNDQADNISHLEGLVENLRENSQQQATTIETLSTKLKESQNNQTQLEEQFNNEIEAQKKLIAIYKDASTESEGKVGELLRAVEELQNLLKTAGDANRELENQRQEDVAQCHEVIKQRDEAICQLERELKDANVLLEAAREKSAAAVSEETIASMFPTAARTSALLKSGMTLTQIYSEYAKTCEELLTEREEKEQLNLHVNQIMEEIEEKAPVLKKQREDFERALVTIENLTGQLDSAMLEFEKVQQVADENSRLKADVQRENNRLRIQTTDLSHQVRVLLKELEEARGNIVSLSPQKEPETTGDVTSSSQLITDRLVTFRGITELQEQNQKLLQVVRNLSDEKEKEEKELVDSKSRELKMELELVQEELGRLRESRERQAKQVETLVRQRDMYYVLLKQNTTDPLPKPQVAAQSPQPGFSPVTPAARVADVSMDRSTAGQASANDTASTQALQETTNALKELQEEFATYRKEKAENQKMIEEQLERFRKEASDKKVLNARLASQLDFSAERAKILESNIEGYKKEISTLRDRNTKYTAMISKLEQTVATLRQEALNSQERTARAEVTAQNLRTERDMLKTIEQRLLADKESQAREQRSHQLMMANLQAIQNNLERSEFETKTQLTESVSRLEKENKVLRRRLDTAEGQHRGTTSMMEKQLSQAKESLSTEEVAHRNAKMQLQTAEHQVQQLKDEVAKAEAQFAAAEKTLTNVTVQRSSVSSVGGVSPGSGGLEELKDARSQLQQAHGEIKALKSQVVKFKQQADQYKDMADRAENTLAEQIKQSEELKAWMESQVSEATAARESVEKQLSEMEAERNKLLEDIHRGSEDNRAQAAGLRQQLTAVQTELADVLERGQRSTSEVQQAHSSRDSQAALAKEAQDKYQRELMQHSATMEQLTGANQQLETAQDDIRAAQEAHKAAATELETAKSQWSSQVDLLKEDKGRLERRVSELQTQNSLLHDELEQVTAQMSKLQQHTAQEDALAAELAKSVASADSEEGGEGGATKPHEQLLEVIKFVRREKEVAVAKLEVLMAESERLRHQVSTTQRQLDEARAAVTAEREKAQVSLQTAAQHAELMHKVEQLNLLQDSNRFLREEKERLNTQLAEAEKKVDALSSELEPMQARQADLISQQESLQTEKAGLEAELQRWKARTTHLIEQCNKADPEEINRLTGELEKAHQRIGQLSEESAKARAEISKVNNLLSTRTTELNQARTELTQAKQTATTANAEIEKLKNQESEKNRINNQLKQVARRYKEQTAKTQSQVDELTAKLNKFNAEELQATVKSQEEEMSKLKQQLTAVEAERDRNTREAQQEVTKLKEANEEAQKKHREQNEEQETKTKVEKEEKEKIQKVVEELNVKMQEDQKKAETELNKFRTIVNSAKARLNAQKQQLDTATAENQDLKKQISSNDTTSGESDKRLKAMQSQLNNQKVKMQQLQNELQEARRTPPPAAPPTLSDTAAAEIEQLKKENAALKEKIASLKKQIEQIPSSSAATVVTTTPPDRPSSSTAETGTVRTANIRPLSTPASTQQRQSAPVQPVRSSSGGPGTETQRATASIRPMAVTGTPTATVMPTTIHEPLQQTQQQGEVSSSHVPSQPQQQQVTPQVRQVQPVSPHIEDSTPQPPSLQQQQQQPESSGEAMMPEPSTSSQHPATVIPVAAVPSAQPSSQPSAQSSAQPPAQPSTSTAKRPRDSTETTPDDDEDEVAQKRSRMAAPAIPTQQQTTEQEQLPEYTEPGSEEQEEQSQTPVALVEPAQQIVEASTTEEEGEEEEAVQESDSTAQVDMTGEEEEEDVELQEEEDQNEEEQSEDCVMIGEEEEEEEEGLEEYAEEGEELDYDEMDDEDEDEEEEMREEDEEEDGDDDVILVDDDDDEESNAGMAESTGTSTTTATPASSTQPATTAPAAQAASSSTATSSASTARPQLQFSSMMASEGGGGGSVFEDDSIVPSTPTLFIPRRTDGFAEAVSSPQVPSRQFVFGGNSSTAEVVQPELGAGALSTQGGMDATSIDLVPQLETPSISVSEASPPPPSTEMTGAAATSSASSPSHHEHGAGEVPVAEPPVVSSTSQQQLPSSAAAAEPAAAATEGGAGDTAASKVSPATAAEPDTEAASTSNTGDSGPARPKIEPIVWDSPGASTSSAQASSSMSHQPPQQQQIQQLQQQQQQQQQPISSIIHQKVQQPPAPQHQQRKYIRGGPQQHRGSRGGSGFHGLRPQGPYRSRGPHRGAPRGRGYRQQPQQQQPPF